MNKIDFQNGFALGMATNGVVELGDAKAEQEKSINITENGTTEILPDEGKSLSKVTVNVNVASSDNEADKEIWSDTVNLAYNEELGFYMSECAVVDLSHIVTGNYIFQIGDTKINVTAIVENVGEIMMQDDAGNAYIIAEDGSSVLFGTTVEYEGEYKVSLLEIDPSTIDVNDTFVFYSEQVKSEPISCFYLTTGFGPGKVCVTISTKDNIIYSDIITFDGMENYVMHYSYSLIPSLIEYINEPLLIVFSQIKDNGDVVTFKISGEPQIVTVGHINNPFYVWGNSDKFALPS